jgi:hypothetical protein
MLVELLGEEREKFRGEPIGILVESIAAEAFDGMPDLCEIECHGSPGFRGIFGSGRAFSRSRLERDSESQLILMYSRMRASDAPCGSDTVRAVASVAATTSSRH